MSFEPWLELAKTENGGNSETASSTKMTSLEELIPSLDISNSHEFQKLEDKKSDYDFEELAEADNAFWDSLEAIKPLRAIAKIDGFEVTIQDGLQVEESFANDRSQLIPITVQNFSTDIDTAIEESPIYQNKAKKSDNSSDDPKLIDSDDQV